MTSYEMISVQDVADYVTVKLADAGSPLSVLKLHKLLYYIQAWHLAFHGRRLFNSDFQAWVHGPVSRIIYDRYRESKSMYSRVSRRDIQPGFVVTKIPRQDRRHIDSILEAYAEYSDTQLEELTHRERPWKLARIGYEPNQRCEVPIRDSAMRNYYGSRLRPNAEADV